MSGPERSRPSTDVATVVLDSLDSMAGQLLARVDGLTNDEYLWEPVPAMWSVRGRGDGSVTVDRVADRGLDPAPVTTIAWRLWHLSYDCFADYTRRLQGEGDDVGPDTNWFLDADEAIASLEASWIGYRTTISSRENWWGELGPAWGPWAQHSIVDMALHAGNELVHHGAEIALLRDLYPMQRTDSISEAEL